jgi:hypothetical protein
MGSYGPVAAKLHRYDPYRRIPLNSTIDQKENRYSAAKKTRRLAGSLQRGRSVSVYARLKNEIQH